MGQTAALAAGATGGFVLSGFNPAGAVAGASLASSLYSIKNAKKPVESPTIAPLPTMPNAGGDSMANAQAGANAALLTKKRLLGAQGRSSTLLTGPQGITAPAATQRSTLLGR